MNESGRKRVREKIEWGVVVVTLLPEQGGCL